jgi:Dual specificity phosphatase, catalytic domain
VETLYITGILNCSCSIPNLFPQMSEYCTVNISNVNATIPGMSGNSICPITQPWWHVVHCRVGRSRSVAIVVAYAIRYHGFTQDTALSYIRQRQRRQPQIKGSWYSSLSSSEAMSQYYTVEWAVECRKHYQTLGMPDVCSQHARWIPPIALMIMTEDPNSSMLWFQAVLTKLAMGLLNHLLHDGWTKTHIKPLPRRAIRTDQPKKYT